MKDNFYQPADFTVDMGSEVTFTVKNSSDRFEKHDLTIVSGVYSELVEVKNAMEADQGIVVATLEALSAGDSGSLVVTFDRPGQYQFFCSIVGHFVAGMHGTITVEG